MIFIVLLISYVSVQVEATFGNPCAYIHSDYVDPIVSPGAKAAHMHDFVGSLQITPTTKVGDLMNSSCTTCSRQGDKSAYWFPSVYFIHKNGTEVKLNPLGNSVGIYYNFGKSANSSAEIINMIPNGLKMIVGSSKAKSPADNKDFIVSIWDVSKDFKNVRPIARNPTGIPKGPIQNARMVQIAVHTPPCMKDSTILDSDDHKSHLSYTDPATDKCPPSHPYRIPSVNLHPRFLLPEPSSWQTMDDMPLRLSVSEKRGNIYQWHIDVFFAWEQKNLASLMQKCNNTKQADCKEEKNPEQSKCTKEIHDKLKTNTNVTSVVTMNGTAHPSLTETNFIDSLTDETDV